MVLECVIWWHGVPQRTLHANWWQMSEDKEKCMGRKLFSVDYVSHLLFFLEKEVIAYERKSNSTELLRAKHLSSQV